MPPIAESPRRERAFTLVELLATVGIALTLAALLLTGIQRMRGSADKAACVSNLRQVYLGLQLFAGEYGAYPNANAPAGSQPAGMWAKRLEEFLPTDSRLPGAGSYNGKGVFTCPARLRQYPGAPEAARSATYGMNNWLAGTGQWTHIAPVRPGQITFPARTILVGDGVWSEQGKYPFQNIQNDMAPGSVRDRVGNGQAKPGVHGDGAANLLYADGHVEWFNDTEKLRQAAYSNKGPEDLWNPLK